MAGVVCCVLSPVFGLVLPFTLFLSLLRCLYPPPLLLSSFPPFVFSVTALLVLGCVFVTGLRHCGIAVMVCAGRKSVWRVGFGSSSSLSLFLFLFLFVLVFGVVRAQPREHARYPRTPLCSLVFSLLYSSPFFAPRLSCYCGMAGGIHHVSVCLVGMTATGSLSLSSSFFW